MRREEGFLPGLLGSQSDDARTRLLIEKFQSHRSPRRRREVELGRDDLPAAGRAPHSSARAEAETCPTRDIGDRACKLLAHDVADFGLEDRLAGANGVALVRASRGPIEHTKSPLSVAIDQAPRGHRSDLEASAKLASVGYSLAAG